MMETKLDYYIENLQKEVDSMAEKAIESGRLEQAKIAIGLKLNQIDTLTEYQWNTESEIIDLKDELSNLQIMLRRHIDLLQKAINFLQFFGVGQEGFNFISNHTFDFVDYNRSKLQNLNYENLLMIEGGIRKLANYKRLLDMPLSVPKSIEKFVEQLEIIDANESSILKLLQK